MADDARRSRRRRGGPLAVFLLLGALAVGWVAWSGALPQIPGGGETPPDGVPADAFALTVGYVFDGDTLEATVQTPNEVVPTADPVRIRLIGIDTPEGTPFPECWADEARAHLRALLPAGSTAWAAPDAEWRDRYDRALLYLWTEDGRFVNNELVAAGDAVTLRIPPNTTHHELFAASESAASASAAGQWGACR